MVRRKNVTLGPALTCALLLFGCTSQPAAERVNEIESLRTDADGRALVASYTGGACDGPDRLAVTESVDKVEVSVRVKPLDNDGDSACPSIGIGRFVRAELSSPISNRTVLVDGKQVQPYDGKDLVAPTVLPDGFALRLETGNLPSGSWTRIYGPPRSGELGAPCRAGDRSVSISTGPKVGQAFEASYFTDEGPADVGDGEARVYIQGSGPVRHLAFRLEGQPVALSYSADCGGPTPTAADLVEVAAGLRPQ